ncbi:dopamine beta-hydroxylase isoform X2 [Meles meles]|uniref:dopamine beta-hydroxylase isoform X2 n=1 Tax=Meles meles TaxID=9662 RepID=UPI001E69A58F|nr:dopamine beta-hydroxylase isoform X2 [Meles meles]
MYGTAVAVFLVILVAALQGSGPPESPFPYRVPLDPEGSLELSWNVSYTQEMVYFQLLVRELKAGVLFGMSNRGELENADLVVLWTDGDSAYFGDAWSDEQGRIHLDSQQDYQLLQARRTPDGLCLLFKRPFGTCDPKDYLIEDGTVHLVYGVLEEPFGSLEAINTSGLQIGLQRVQLLKPNISIPALPSDLRSMEIRAPDVLIPGKKTTYWCHVTELPDGFSRHHIVMAFYYPEEAGLAFGGAGSSRFLRLEVHYHNPLEIQGRRDSSGIRLYYTATLRRFDAGIMELGLVYTPLMAIPPQETAFVLTGYCTDKCTQMALPPSGIHIFASQLHTHLTGRKVVTVLARNGQEKEIVNRDDHYSPHFQEIRMLKKVVSVQPGDVLITSCTYDTGDRDLATVGGFGILEEMCVNYVHYYPRTQLELCKSAVDAGFLRKYFHTVNRFNAEEVCTCQQASVPEQFASVPWNSFSRDMLKAVYGFAPISVHCNKSTAVRFPGEWDLQPLPKITSKLDEPTPRCPASRGQSPTSPTVVSIGGSRS